ncbi:MAG: ferrochelatase, partial [Thermoanaerobaculia bacterium]
PQGSPATTEILKYHFNEIIKEENLEGLIFPEYYKHPEYIKAVSEKIKEKKASFDFIVFSYHGLPVKMEGAFEYKEKCIKTTEMVIEDLNFSKEKTITSFQSRFGFGRWLKPSTLEILKDLSRKNFQKIAIMSPSFPLDCLETLYDINIYFREYFRKISGKDLTYIDALNLSKGHIEFLKNFIVENL